MHVDRQLQSEFRLFGLVVSSRIGRKWEQGGRKALHHMQCMAVDAGVVELVDTPDLGSGGASRGGSSPSARTISKLLGLAT